MSQNDIDALIARMQGGGDAAAVPADAEAEMGDESPMDGDD